ncbi:hypothetical protein MMC06_003870 [Schaereria dolodes]|nr:hypothetical protein [Schaereria dolodes]
MEQIPGIFIPPLILLLLPTYLLSFIVASRNTSPFKVVSDEVDITIPDAARSKKRGRAGSWEYSPSLANGKISIKEKEPELDIQESTALGDPYSQALKTVLLGLPSPTSRFWSLLTVAINVSLSVFVADLVYRTPLLYQSQDLSFARVGYVSDTSASIMVREPDVANLPIYVSYRRAPEPDSSDIKREDPWNSAGKCYWLSNDTDWTYSLTISLLKPSSRYQYAVSNNHSGFFTTAPLIGQTAPDSEKFTFLTSSCIKPRFPYSPFSHPLHIPGFFYLAKWIPVLKASFMLFLGDFIYIDVPRRLGTDVETYRRDYRQVYASPDWPSVSDHLPWIHVIDDHEIANDWDQQTSTPYPAAIDPWQHYHGSINPPPSQPGVTYFEFTQGPASFFLMDTRRYRSRESATNVTSPEKTMLGVAQLSSLLAYLSRREPEGVKWKIVVSSIPFTRNWRLNSIDTWAGYLHERQIVLKAMWDVGTRGDGVGVVVLSGDRHEHATTAFPPPKDSKWPLSATVHEFSTSPLSMFYLPVRTYWEVEGEDEICVNYTPDGNSKFGAVEITTLKGGEQSLLKFRLFVDGVETWAYSISSPPAIAGWGRGKDAVWG